MPRPSGTDEATAQSPVERGGIAHDADERVFTLHSLLRTHAQMGATSPRFWAGSFFSSAGGPVTAVSFSRNQIMRYDPFDVSCSMLGQPIWCFELVVFRGGCEGRASFADPRRREIALAEYLAAAGNQLIPPIFVRLIYI